MLLSIAILEEHFLFCKMILLGMVVDAALLHRPNHPLETVHVSCTLHVCERVASLLLYPLYSGADVVNSSILGPRTCCKMEPFVWIPKFPKEARI